MWSPSPWEQQYGAWMDQQGKGKGVPQWGNPEDWNNNNSMIFERPKSPRARSPLRSPKGMKNPLFAAWATQNNTHNRVAVSRPNSPSRAIHKIKNKMPKVAGLDTRKRNRLIDWPGINPHLPAGSPPYTVGFKPNHQGRPMKYKNTPQEVLQAELAARTAYRREKQRQWISMKRKTPSYKKKHPRATGKARGRPRKNPVPMMRKSSKGNVRKFTVMKAAVMKARVAKMKSAMKTMKKK